MGHREKSGIRLGENIHAFQSEILIGTSRNRFGQTYYAIDEGLVIGISMDSRHVRWSTCIKVG